MRLANRGRLWIVAGPACALLFVFGAARAGSFLIMDDPRPSDIIVVLAGETDRRPARALELLDQGYARRVLIDVPAEARIYTFTELDMAQKYVQSLPQSANVSVCATEGLSTK